LLAGRFATMRSHLLVEGVYMPAKILVADDHEVVRQGIRTILQARPDWEICGEAGNGEEAIRLVRQLRPDVVIMDITMPVMSGLEAARELAKLQLPSRVLIFTMHESKSLGSSVRKAGAHGYVVKARAARDLIEALDRLLSGGTFFDNASTSAEKSDDKPDPNILFRQALSLI
jgi:DNA-binding NarL/FixJ family response regulator